MNSIAIGLLSVLLATNQIVAASNAVLQTTGVSITLPNPNDPVEKEYQKLLADDDAAQADADRQLRENNILREKGAGVPDIEITTRISQRFQPVRKAYEDFIKRHPDHARVRLAYGSFLNEIGQEEEAVTQWEKGRVLDPKNPAAWNNLANYYGHRGPVTNAFKYYEKAIELNPNEPVYYHNFGTTLYLFRRDAEEMYHLNEQQVFDRALAMYDKALKLDPNDFVLAQDIAQTYYGIRPMRVEAALAAWDYTLKLAKDELQREGVFIHQARIKINIGRFEEAREHLNAITNSVYNDLKVRLTKNLAAKEAKAKGTNSLPVEAKP